MPARTRRRCRPRTWSAPKVSTRSRSSSCPCGKSAATSRASSTRRCSTACPAPTPKEAKMSDPFIGEIRMFGGNFAPVGWLLCQGQTLPIALYDTLFNLIGTTYGGDGQETFQLPNLQSRLPVHQGSGYVLGQTGGAETVTLTPQQMPLHSHAATAATSGAGAAGPAGNVWRDFGRPVYST